MGKKPSQGQAAAVVIGFLWLSIGGQVWVTLRDRRLDQQGAERLSLVAGTRAESAVSVWAP